MIVNVSFIALLILAAYGLRGLLEKISNKDKNWLLGLFGGAAGLSLLLLIFQDSFSFFAAREAGQYQGQTLDIIKGIRREIFNADVVKVLLLTLISGAVLAAWFWKKMSNAVLIVLLSLLIFTELFTITYRANQNMQLQNKKQLEYRLFQPTDITKILKKADESYRLLALGKEFQSNYYPYFFPSINGYSAIKMQRIQDMIDHSLFKGAGPTRLNWNVVNMLGGRYIVAPSQLPNTDLRLLAQDKQRGELLYENDNALPKAWFISTLEKLDNDAAVITRMNESIFDPLTTVYSTDNIETTDYSGQGTIELLSFSPNRLCFDVKCDESQFVVFSELAYPGWKLMKEDKDIPLYRVNYLLRGAEIPAGNYRLEMEFHPQSYERSRALVLAGNLIMWAWVIGTFYFSTFRKRPE